MKIGFHMSIARGFDYLSKEFMKLGCESLQIFVKNPRSWVKKDWTYEEIFLFKKNFSSVPVFAHLSYLPNLAEGSTKDFSGFFEEIELSLKLGIGSIVIHPGSNKNKSEAVERISVAIKEAKRRYQIDILIENSSGQGNSLCSSVEEMSRIFEKIKSTKGVKICLDLAHLFQAGIDVRDPEVWEKFLSSLEMCLGKGRIGLLHINDSKTDLGSRIDRHWHIGLGKLGKRTFARILNDERLKDLCGIMETPGMGKLDSANMKTIRSLLGPSAYPWDEGGDHPISKANYGAMA
ncbi:MAG: deoxyribonuclease IV [Desulfatiglandales bacterium]